MKHVQFLFHMLPCSTSSALKTFQEIAPSVKPGAWVQTAKIHCTMHS